MKGYTKVTGDKVFVDWLNQVWSGYLLLKAYPDHYIQYEKTERKFLWFNLKPKITAVSARLPSPVGSMVYLSNYDIMGDNYTHFNFNSGIYNYIPELAALLDRGECWLDGDMLNLYNILLQEREQQDSNPSHFS